jgi:hypothetical protein
VKVAVGIGSTAGSGAGSGFVTAAAARAAAFFFGTRLRFAAFGPFFARAFFFAAEGALDFFFAGLSFFAAIPPPCFTSAATLLYKDDPNFQEKQ